MDSGFYSAFTGLAARMQALDLLANNLANVNTVGYKAQKEFYRAFAASLNNRAVSPVNTAINDYVFQLLGIEGKVAERAAEHVVEQAIIDSISQHMSHSSAGDFAASDGGHGGEGGGH